MIRYAIFNTRTINRQCNIISVQPGKGANHE
jgi:hypothetical protein